MLNFFRTDKTTIEFCERCGNVCDSRCRAEAIRSQAADQALRYGWRQA